jgi:hypothetical protein
MNDDLTTLASAYLDGDVTADERARVESSDELLLEVDRLRTVRALVSNASLAEAAPISMRERHLSAALDAWDRLPDSERTGALRDATPGDADRAAAAGVAAMSSPARRSAKRRRMQSPVWLGAAAAGLVLVMAGGLVLRNTASDGGADTAELTSAESADQATSAEAPAPAAAGDALSEAELEESARASAADTAPIENGSDVDTDIAAEAPPAETGALEQLDTSEELAIFASDAIGAPVSEDLPDDATVVTDPPADVLQEADEESDAAALPLCQGADIVVGVAIYVDEPVVVGIDERRNRAVAYREDDCSLVASASLS